MITIHSVLTGKTPEQICKEVEDIDTGRYKFTVADAVIAHLAPIRKKIMEYLSEPRCLVEILEEGADKAKDIAEKTAGEVRSKLGLSFDVKNIKNIKIKL